MLTRRRRMGNDEHGQPEYDIPLWSEPIGAISVPTNENGDIILIRINRPAALPTEAIGEYPLRDVRSCGTPSLQATSPDAEVNAHDRHHQ